MPPPDEGLADRVPMVADRRRRRKRSRTVVSTETDFGILSGMVAFTVWSVACWLWWASAVRPGEPVVPGRTVYGLEDRRGRRRWFETVPIGGRGADAQAMMVRERRGPLGVILAGHPVRPVFRLRLIDVDGDGSDELALGVVWHDHTRRRYRRVYIFALRAGVAGIRPLWLGSRLSYRLCDFTVARRSCGGDLLVAREWHRHRHYLGRYLWHEFGFRSRDLKEVGDGSAVAAPDDDLLGHWADLDARPGDNLDAGGGNTAGRSD